MKYVYEFASYYCIILSVILFRPSILIQFPNVNFATLLLMCKFLDYVASYIKVDYYFYVF